MPVFRLGARVVHATYTRLIVDTGKHTCADANAYVQYVIETVQRQSLFAAVDVRCVRVWANLIWMDAYNYAGVREHKQLVAADDEGARTGKCRP
jgi:DNA polymerase epsilon subunit 1